MSYIDTVGSSRSRLLGSSDHESLLRESFLSPSLQGNFTLSNSKLRQLSNQISNNVFLEDEWHSEDYLNLPYEEYQTGDDSWRLKGRMKTAGVALVVCLNIGVDPPDVIKPNPCARKECWFDPTHQKTKGLEVIGNALQQQYEKWQSKAKFKQCLDPSSEDLRKVCLSLRKSIKGDRVLFHYNGHGVPKPTKNGEVWVFGKHHTHYTPVAVRELKQWLGDPTIFVLDCSGAGVLIPHLVEGGEGGVGGAGGGLGLGIGLGSPDPAMSAQASLDTGSVILAACKATETLPFHPQYPADIFTSCLTTPTTLAMRWFILQNPQSMRDVSPDIAELIPGKDNERKSPRGELNWILTAITDTIAWHTLPAKMFKKMFRHDLLVASLFRNFLMAKRIMKTFQCTPQSYPALPDSTTHPLWEAWDMSLSSFLSYYTAMQRGTSMVLPLNNMGLNSNTHTHIPTPSQTTIMPSSVSHYSNLQFFNDQLNAFEMWLDFAQGNSAKGVGGLTTHPSHIPSPSSPPLQLPVVLQVLLSQSHRLRALQLLKRYLSLGLDAVKTALILGIYPYIVKLLQTPTEEVKSLLVSIWAAILAFDSTCKNELIREKSIYIFIHTMTQANLPNHTHTPASHTPASLYAASPCHSQSVCMKTLACFVCAEVCSASKEGQQACIQLSLHRALIGALQSVYVPSPSPSPTPGVSGGQGYTVHTPSPPPIPNAYASSASNSPPSPSLILWICLCMYKYIEENIWGKYICLTEGTYTVLFPTLAHPLPSIRTACVCALGELFGASTLIGSGVYGGGIGGGGSGSRNNSSGNLNIQTPAQTPSHARYHTSLSSEEDMSARTVSIDERDLIEAEVNLALQLLECCTDGSVMVRLEAVYALSKFVIQPAHLPCMKIVAKYVYERYYEKKMGRAGGGAGVGAGGDRRSASPESVNGGGSNPSSVSGGTSTFLKGIAGVPWYLTPLETQKLAEMIESNLESRGVGVGIGGVGGSIEDWGVGRSFGGGGGLGLGLGGEGMPPPPPLSTPPSTAKPPLHHASHSSNSPNSHPSHLPSHSLNASNAPLAPPTHLASAYIRIWLSLIEVEHKDPYSLLATAVCVIRNRLGILVALSEKDRIMGNKLGDGASAAGNGDVVSGSLASGSVGGGVGSMFGNEGASIPFPSPTPSNMPYPSPFTPQTRPAAYFSSPDGAVAPSNAGGGGGGGLNMYSEFAIAAMTTPKGGVGLGGVGGGGSFGNDLSGLGMGNGVGASGDGLLPPGPYLQPFSPIMSASYSSPSRARSLRANTSFSNLGGGAGGGGAGRTAPNPLPAFPASLDSSMLGKNTGAEHHPATPLFPTPHSKTSPTPTTKHHSSKNIFLEHYKEFLQLNDEDVLICFSSNHYEMMKKKFIEGSRGDEGDGMGSLFGGGGGGESDLLYDPLSPEATYIEFRAQRIQDLLTATRHLTGLFKEVEDRSQDIVYMERSKNMESSSHSSKSPAPPAALISHSSNICKFEQKGNTLTIDNNMVPSMVMFHAYQDILVVAHGSTAEIWSTTSHAKILEIKNKHQSRHGNPQCALTGNHVSVNNTLAGHSMLPNDVLANQHTSSARITAMTWINESYDALLLLGSDDGAVHIWRDISHSESNNAVNTSMTSSSSPAVHGHSNVELASALVALPDIDLASRGSGTVLSWQQAAGSLVVGGNSNTIRVWDLGREQNVRTFHTGHETCVTALASMTVSSQLFNGSYALPSAGTDVDSVPATWTFAGFADGSIAVFDERVPTNGGRVHFSHTHSNWVSHVYLRAELPEVVIGSVRGSVKFWDLRTQRTYKTLEVQKSALTALAVHPAAPIMATGSHAQFIKLLTLSGEQIGNIIKYYDGFLGQRIGPVSSLAFHPTKLMLAAGTIDGVVSLYGANV